MAKTKTAVTTSTFRAKAKKRGKSKKSFGPKDQKPKKYRGQGK
jgi:hypothetical protein